MAHDAYDLRLRDVVEILRRRRQFILRVWAVGIAAGALVSLFVHPVYRAGASITADKIPPVILLDQAAMSGQNVPTPNGMASPDIPTLVALAQSEQVRARASHLVESHRAELAIKKTLRAQQYRTTQYVRITVDDSDPAIAAEAADAVAAGLIDIDLVARRQWAKETRLSIQEQLLVVDPKLRSAEDALVAFRAQFGDVPISDATVATLNRLAQLEAQRVDITLQQQEARARLDAARIRLAGQAQMAPTAWKPSPLITTLQSQLATEEVELSGLRQLFTAKHPQVLDVSAKIAETKQKLNAELTHSLRVDQYGVDPVYQQLAQQVKQDEVAGAALEARERALGAAIAQYENNVRQLPAREVMLTRLTRNVKETEAIHQILTNKLQQALVTEASIGSAIRIVDRAVPPMAPVRPRSFGLMLGTFLGLLLGVGGALVMEQMLDPIKSTDHGKHALGAPILGMVPALDREPEDAAPGHGDLKPWTSLAARRRASSASRRSAFAEAFRHLRTNLICLGHELPRTLMVTSAVMGDDKDIVSGNLAIALARAGLRVWLVDCDLRRPSLAHAPFVQPAREGTPAGLADLLAGGASERAVVQRTSVENLWFLPAGTRPADPAELLGGPRMRFFLQQDREDVDIIVLSAPPVLTVTDAAALGRSVAGVLLTVEAGGTQREAAQRARQHLDEVGAQVLGIVVVGLPMDGVGCYFDYYARYYQTEQTGVWYLGPRPRQAPARLGRLRDAAQALGRHLGRRH